jgi:hypothetical protein
LALRLLFTKFTSRETPEEASKMDKANIRVVFLGLCTIALVAVLSVGWPAYAIPTHSPNVTAAPQDTPQAQSISGTIASVGRNSFTLTIGPSTSSPAQHMQQTSPKSMTFLIDQNTTVEGKLKVGANADVTYREDNGNNVAISVRVAS